MNWQSEKMLIGNERYLRRQAKPYRPDNDDRFTMSVRNAILKQVCSNIIKNTVEEMRDDHV